jgi:hypothetical protein
LLVPFVFAFARTRGNDRLGGKDRNQKSHYSRFVCRQVLHPVVVVVAPVRAVSRACE